MSQFSPIYTDLVRKMLANDIADRIETSVHNEALRLASAGLCPTEALKIVDGQVLDALVLVIERRIATAATAADVRGRQLGRIKIPDCITFEQFDAISPLAVKLGQAEMDVVRLSSQLRQACVDIEARRETADA